MRTLYQSTPPARFLSRLFPSVISVLLPVLLLSVLAGCSKLNCTRFENIFGRDTNLVNFSYEIADSLIDRALPPLVPVNPDLPVVVTTFVDNNDLEKTTKFGRLLQEHISSRFVQQGYTVREMKLGNSLSIEPRTGETILTRDLSKIESSQSMQAILVGTYSRTNRILYISSRLVNPNNNTIIASSDYKLCMDDDILDLLNLTIQSEGNMVEEPSQPLLNKML